LFGQVQLDWSTIKEVALVTEKRDSPSTIVIEKCEEPTVVEKRSLQVTASVGCSTTTKQKTDEFGDTTVKQTTEC
jgi:hypothetical protein